MSKKDACYHKVKARYKVFPSAYASGAIAKCRKVGAANWGNKTQKKAGGGMMKSKGYRNGGVVNKRKATGAAKRGFGKAYMKGKR